MRKLYNFFDKFEDKIRGRLSHYPIFYAFVGAVGIVLFWRGVWHTMDFIVEFLFVSKGNISIDLGVLPWWDGPLSIAIGSVLLLSAGLFVSGFIGSEVILSGLRGEKKLTERTEEEVRTEAEELNEVKREIKEIAHDLAEIKKNIK